MRNIVRRLLALACYWLGDVLWNEQYARDSVGPVISEPPYGEQDTRPYEDTEPLQQGGW